MISINKISCFLPAYNEADIIFNNVKKIYANLNELNNDFELFIVDDASKDNSFDKLKPLVATYKNIYYLHYDNGPSKRENLAQAFYKSSGNIIVFIDVDLEIELNSLNLLVQTIINGSDIAIGNRYLKGSSASRRPIRLMISKFYNFFIQIIFCTKITDHQCGFKAFKKNILIKLIDEMGHDLTHKRGWFWDSELLIRALWKKNKITEIEVNWQDRINRRFSIIENLKIIPFIFKLKSSEKILH